MIIFKTTITIICGLILLYYIIGFISSLVYKYILFLRIKYGILKVDMNLKNQLFDFFKIHSVLKFIFLATYDAYQPIKNIQKIKNVDNLNIY